MTKRHKDFGGAEGDGEEVDPVGFTLFDEDFECYPELPGANLLEFVKLADGDGGGGSTAEALFMLFERSMPEDEYNRFSDLIHDPARSVSIERLGEIASWLVETYTKRPTRRVSNSSGGRKRSGRTSTRSASSEESTLAS